MKRANAYTQALELLDVDGTRVVVLEQVAALITEGWTRAEAINALASAYAGFIRDQVAGAKQSA